MDLESPLPFFDFPYDIQIKILSLLHPRDICNLACTCRSLAALCSLSFPSSDLWLAVCDRRWGSNTQIRRWSAAPWLRIYKVLNCWEQLIGFWQRGFSKDFFVLEWRSSCIIGYFISPSPVAGSYAVCKTPFLWLGLSASGKRLIYFHPFYSLSDPDVNTVRIDIQFQNCFIVNSVYWEDRRMEKYEDLFGLESGSPPDPVMSEIYEYFDNRRRPGAKVLQEAEHFNKIPDPTIYDPLVGLWKGISEDMILKFYHVEYDDQFGGTYCRQYDNSENSFVFRTDERHEYLESPFSKEELDIYSKRKHIRSLSSVHCTMNKEVVSRIMCIKGDYDYDLACSSGDPMYLEGRIWLYEDGTFGFGFLKNDFIVDLKHIALDGHILNDV